jgi:hypothetical protein
MATAAKRLRVGSVVPPGLGHGTAIQRLPFQCSIKGYVPLGNGVCVPTTQASDSPSAATAHKVSAPPDGADPAPVTAGDGAGLAGLWLALAGPEAVQPAPRMAATGSSGGSS